MKRTLLALVLLLSLNACGSIGPWSLMTGGALPGIMAALQGQGNPMMQPPPANPVNMIQTLTAQMQAQQAATLASIERYNKTIAAFTTMAATLKPIEIGGGD